MNRDGRNFLLLIGLATLVGLWVGQQQAALPKLPRLSGLGGVAPPTAPIDVAAQPPELTQEFAAPVAAPTVVDSRLDASFCPAPGETETIRYRYTLANWLKRLDPDDDEVAAILKRFRRGEGAPLLDSLDRALGRSREKSATAQLWALRAMLMRDAGRPSAVAESLRQAYRADPTVAAIAIETGLALRHTPYLDDAVRALSAYQKVEPQLSLKRTVALLEVDRDLREGFQKVERDGVVVQFTDDGFDMARARTLAESLSTALDEAARLTDTPRRESLTAVVYPGREELFAATCVRSWTAAVYDGTLRLVVARGTASGVDTISLRHESMHAQAIPFAPDAPRWFHEGLADLFANDAANARPLWARLVANHTWIPAASLEGSLGAIEANDSAQLAYAQSLAMVTKLRDDAGEPGLRQALDAFKAGRKTVDVLRELRVELEGEPLLAWMAANSKSK